MAHKANIFVLNRNHYMILQIKSKYGIEIKTSNYIAFFFFFFQFYQPKMRFLLPIVKKTLVGVSKT